MVADALGSFAADDVVMVDFNLPATAGPISAATLSGGWATPGSAPVMTPLWMNLSVCASLSEEMTLIAPVLPADWTACPAAGPS